MNAANSNPGDFGVAAGFKGAAVVEANVVITAAEEYAYTIPLCVAAYNIFPEIAGEVMSSPSF